MTPNITLQPAEADDVHDIFRWRNDPVTRANSFTSEEIVWETHRRWFEQSMQREDRLLLIGRAASAKIGIVRFDISADGDAEININLAPEARGQGYGAQFIRAANDYLFEHKPTVTTVYAKIKPENLASVRAFERAGYQPFSTGEYVTLVLRAGPTTSKTVPNKFPWRGVFLRQALQFSSANIFSQIARFLKNFAFARMLGPDLFGLWFALQVILIYGPNAHLGVHHALTREIPFNRGRGDNRSIGHLVHTGFSFTIISGLVVAALLFGATVVFARPPVESVAIRLIALALFTQMLYQFFHFLLRAEDNFALLSKVLVISVTLELVGSLALVYVFGLNGIFYGLLISASVAVAICLYCKPQLLRHFEFDPKILASLIRIGFPIMLVGLSYNLLTTIDRVMIKKFLGSEAVGFYAIGPLALAAISYVPITINQVLYPKFGERFGGTGDPKSLGIFVRKPTLVTAQLMGLALGCAFLALPLVTFILPKYTPGVPAARIIFTGFYFLSLVGAFANLLVTINRQVQYLFILLFSVGVGLVLDYLALTADLGIEGVAAATALNNTIYTFGLVIFTLRRHLHYNPGQLLTFLGKLLLPFVTAAAAIGVAAQVHMQNVIAASVTQLVVFSILYGVVFFVMVRRELRA